MASLTALVVRAGVRRLMKPDTVDDGFVESLRNRTTGRGIDLLPRRVGRRVTSDGELVGVPGARRHLLYLHGGYYLAGRPDLYRNLTGRLADGLDADVRLLEYRLAPEHPYPAAVDDAFAAYTSMLDAGHDPAAMAVAGDSAGGGLTLALLLRLRERGVALPAAAVLLSPWADLTCTNPSVDANDAIDDMLTAAALRRAGALYAGGHDPAEPELSPGRADLAGLPPLFVTVDRSETLVDDARSVVDAARAAGGRAELREGVGLFHVWPALVPLLPEARRTVGEIVDFLDRELA